MKVTTITNEKTKEAYVTKEGQELQKFELEVGDVILPQQTKAKFLAADSKRKYPEYRLFAKVKDVKTGEIVEDNQGSQDLYLRITKTMANQLNGLVEKANLDIKTKMFEVEEAKRDSDGEPYKKLKIVNPKTESLSFEDFNEDGSLKQ